MQLKFGTCQLRQDALQRKAVALLCRTEALQREPKEALQYRPGHGLLPKGCAAPSFVQSQCNTRRPLSKL